MKNLRFLALAAIPGAVLSLAMITGCNSEEAPAAKPAAPAAKPEADKAAPAPAPAPAAKPAEAKK